MIVKNFIFDIVSDLKLPQIQTITMEIFKILLVIHIAGGATSLILGTYIIFNKKGDKKHKVLGKIYFCTKLSASIVSLPMAYLHPNYFLLIIGVFTSYMLLSGTRYLQKKKLDEVNAIDWLITSILLLFGLGFISFGLLLIGTFLKYA